ncbi:STAS domain-containing protein [Cesiribacter sp. SM1]|uniref:STAS domain-containing protein n=1 Tax=Cesiribacter sp. SM1 TaxID=2861196 RepID=UPI001CD1A540|nr:STAS domain-containing protein [Cesiribacter sp. SM1]
MSYSLTTDIQSGKPARLQLSGSLNIRNVRALHAELLAYASQPGGIHLELREVEEMDVAFLQLLLSLQQHQQQHQQSFYLQLNVNPVLTSFIQFAGIEHILKKNFQ